MRLELKKTWKGHEAGTVHEVPHYIAEVLLKEGVAGQVSAVVAEPKPVVVQVEPVAEAPQAIGESSPSGNATLLSYVPK